MWVFDDAAVGLDKEPFVEGADTAIDLAVAAQGIEDAANGFRLLFSDEAFPGYQLRFDRVRADDGGHWYRCDAMPDAGEGWLCPALFCYFEQAPEHLYTQFASKLSRPAPRSPGAA